MKLKSVKILGDDFRSLTADRRYEFNISEREDRMSTKCFAGLNGSGKSNMLELLTEIFYFLEYRQLKFGDKTKRKGKGFGFEIEYLIPVRSHHILTYSKEKDSKMGGSVGWLHVRIIKPTNPDEDPIEYSVRPLKGANATFVTIEEHFAPAILPGKIIAYTSGQNELLSNPFYKLKYHYFREVSKQTEDVPMNDRMFFIDGANNFNVFVANMLLGIKQKRELIQKAYGIEGLHSFRITINLFDHNNKELPLSKSTLAIIEKLKACATCWATPMIYRSKVRKQLVLDYRIDAASMAAFGFHFNNSALELFKAFYQLEMLNVHKQNPKVHTIVHNAPEWLNLSDELPQIEPDEQIFRIEKISLIKEGKNEEDGLMNYKSLSDGEHQFNEVIGSMMLMEEEGCLLLYDEPDTHFNPKWRASLIKLLNMMAASEYDSRGNITRVRNQEVIITTHSPFAISDSYKSDVYCFRKEDNVVSIHPPNIATTYGTSVQAILESVFDNDNTISNLAHEDLKKIREDANKATTAEEIQEERGKLIGFGESIEKFDTIRYLRLRENQLGQDEK